MKTLLTYLQITYKLNNHFLLVNSSTINPLNPKSDQHLISPYNITPESHIKVMRIKEMITREEPYDWKTNSPCQHDRKCIKKSVENMQTDVRVFSKELQLSK